MSLPLCWLFETTLPWKQANSCSFVSRLVSRDSLSPFITHPHHPRFFTHAGKSAPPFYTLPHLVVVLSFKAYWNGDVREYSLFFTLLWNKWLHLLSTMLYALDLLFQFQQLRDLFTVHAPYTRLRMRTSLNLFYRLLCLLVSNWQLHFLCGHAVGSLWLKDVSRTYL